MTRVTLVTLVAGADADAREAAIAARTATLLHSGATCAVILEGLPAQPANFDPAVALVRLAPLCPCCTGNLTMRVTLNRMLRRPPDQIFISIVDPTHLGATRAFLSATPYATLLTLNDDLII